MSCATEPLREMGVSGSALARWWSGRGSWSGEAHSSTGVDPGADDRMF